MSNANVLKIVNDLAPWNTQRHHNFGQCRLKDDVQKYFLEQNYEFAQVVFDMFKLVCNEGDFHEMGIFQ